MARAYIGPHGTGPQAAGSCRSGRAESGDGTDSVARTSSGRAWFGLVPFDRHQAGLACAILCRCARPAVTVAAPVSHHGTVRGLIRVKRKAVGLATPLLPHGFSPDSVPVGRSGRPTSGLILFGFASRVWIDPGGNTSSFWISQPIEEIGGCREKLAGVQTLMDALELSSECEQVSFQGGRLVTPVAAFVEQCFEYYSGFKQDGADKFFIRASASHNYCFYHVDVYPVVGYHGDSDQVQEPRVQWDRSHREHTQATPDAMD